MSPFEFLGLPSIEKTTLAISTPSRSFHNRSSLCLFEGVENFAFMAVAVRRTLFATV